MRRLVGLTIALSLILALAIGLVQQIGRQQPVPAWSTALHVGACALPCWIDIVPGRTSGNKTFVTIDTVFLTTFQQTVAPTLERGAGNGGVRVPIPDQDHPTAYVGLGFAVSDNTIANTGFRFDPDDLAFREYVPSLGDLVAMLGLPSCIVLPTRGVGGWALIYATAGGIIELRLYQDEHAPASCVSAGKLPIRLTLGWPQRSALFPAYTVIGFRQMAARAVLPGTDHVPFDGGAGFGTIM